MNIWEKFEIKHIFSNLFTYPTDLHNVANLMPAWLTESYLVEPQTRVW